MATCDFCNERTDSATRYGAVVVQRAALTGFRPSGLADMNSVAQRLGLSDFDSAHNGVAQVMADPTDWAVCDTCAGLLEQHLARIDLSSPESSIPSPSIPSQQARDRLFSRSPTRLRASHPPSKWRKRVGATVSVIAVICAVVYFYFVFRGGDVWWAAGLLFAGIGLFYLGNKIAGDE